MNAGEGCDDGNTISGDGCSSSCQVEATPRLDVSVDKPTISTELMSTQMITVTLTGSDGFAGAVTLAPSAVDSAQAPITGWTVVLDKTNVDVPLNGTATAVATLTIPSDSKTLTGSVKFVATSSAGTGTFTAASAVTTLNQVSYQINVTNGSCVFPSNAAGTVNLAVGAKVRWVNNGTQNVTIHVQDGGQYGVPHQPDPGSAPGAAYERTITAADGGTFSWYCHDPSTNVGGMNVLPVQ
jgi:cysteine-rich repeat protein